MLKLIGKLVGAKLEEELIPKEQCHSKETKTKYPELPALFLTPEVVIYETTAIARHLARNSPLYKTSDEVHMAQIDSWMELFKSEVLGKAYPEVIYPILGHSEYTQKSYNEAMASFKGFLVRLKNVEGFLVGTALSIADLFAASLLSFPFALIIDEGMRKSFPKLAAWYTKIASDAAFVEFFGIPRFAKIVVKPILPPKEEAVHDEKKDAKGKKEEKKKETKKPKEGEEEEDDDTGAEKKERNPLDLLPPSSFNLDDFKREFLANKTPETRRAYLKEKFYSAFDAAGWALWFTEYDKAEGEGQVLFMTSNLSNGFLAVYIRS